MTKRIKIIIELTTYKPEREWYTDDPSEEISIDDMAKIDIETLRNNPPDKIYDMLSDRLELSYEIVDK